MAEPALTVGMPVYNAEGLIEESLGCLLSQTLREFRVLVFDNASTDRTGEIVAGLAASDSRIVHVRQPRNVGAEQNFLDALAAAETEYFCWRADDDLSDPEFLERMKELLDANPNAALAAARVESRRPAKNRVRQIPYPRDWPGPRVVNIVRRMFLSHQSWIYSLWRTERLRAYYSRCWEAFPVGWGNDHLVLLNAILDEAVVGDDGARFIQRIDVRGGGGAPRQRPPLSERIAVKEDLLPRFRRVCRDAVAAREWSPAERLVLGWAIEFYVRKRINTSEWQIRRLKLRKAMQDALGRR